MGTILIDGEHIRVEEDREQRVVVLTRKATRPETPEALEQAYLSAMATIRPEHRDFGLVIDGRAAPGNNDPDFEHTMQRLREKVEARFRVVVMVVATAVGDLQARRMNRERGLQANVVRDLDEALAIARGR